MKNLDPKYLAKREARASSFENEFQKPGSVILLSTAVGGFSIYAISATLLMAYDMFLKFFFWKNESAFMELESIKALF